MRIALIGHGAMGSLIARAAANKGHEISVVVQGPDAALTGNQLAEKLRDSDAVMDFSQAAAVRRNVSACLRAGVPLVEGTTGWKAEHEAIETLVRNGGGAMIFGANFSVGVNLFYRITDYAAGLFAKFPEYDAFVEERHHARKKDAPSGTALILREVVLRHGGRDMSVASTRAGSIPGTHRVGFDGPEDQILLEHTARSRAGFASGAVLAAEWIVGKKGFYEFSEVIDEIIASRPSK